MKNILYFTRTMGVGGTENVILQLCEIMREKAEKVTVCSSGGINVEKLTTMGIKHYEIPDIEQKSPLIIIKTFLLLLKILNEENIEIVHTHHRMAAFYTRVLLIFKKIIFINTAHNTFHDKIALTRFSYQKARIVAVGNKVKENLCIFYGLPEKQVTVIQNAIKLFEQKIEPINILIKFHDEGYFLVGNVGRLSEQKGMEYYIKSIPYVLKVCPKVKFFIIGEGEDKEKLNALVSELNLSESIIFLGYRSDIQNVMSQLDLIVLSSLWEGLPLTPIEAFSVGKTIIATAVDGTVEVVEDRVNGLLVKAKDCKALASAIIEIYNDTEKKEMYEKKAAFTYEKDFSFKIMKEKYEKYYKEVTNY